MNNIFVLTKIQFRSTFWTYGTKRKKSSLPKTGAVVLLGLLGLLIAFSFFSMFFGISTILKETSVPTYKIQIVAYIIAAVIMLFFTAFQAQATVFRAKDLDLLMAMPVTPFQILISKIGAFYLSNLLFGALVLAPAAIATFMCDGFSFYLFFVLLINAVTLPCITMTISFIIAFLLSLIPEKSKFNRFFTIFISFLFLGLYLVFYSRFLDIMNEFASNQALFIETAGRYYLPIKFLNEALEGNILSLGGLAAISILIFLVFMYILSKIYFPLIRKNFRTKTKKRVISEKETKKSPVWLAVFKKELGKYFSTSIYVVNTAFGTIILFALAIASLFGESLMPGFQAYVSVFKESGLLLFFACAVCCGIILTVSTTCVSISLEGKNFWIIRSAPISSREILLGKAMVNILVTEPLWIISSILLSVSLKLDIINWLLLFLSGTAAAVVCALLGLLVNLLFPKLNAGNDTQIVKQSLSAFLGIFGGWIISVPIFICAYFLCAISPLLPATAIFIFYVLTAFVIYIILKYKSEKLFNKIVY